jgi:hypothetical protein
MTSGLMSCLECFVLDFITVVPFSFSLDLTHISVDLCCHFLRVSIFPPVPVCLSILLLTVGLLFVQDDSAQPKVFFLSLFIIKGVPVGSV